MKLQQIIFTQLRIMALVTFAGLLLAFPPRAAAQLSPPPGGGYVGDNTAAGDNALYEVGKGDYYNAAIYNTAIGYSALYSDMNGGYNTAIGVTALSGNLSGSNNTATGFGALDSNDASYNTATGYQALATNTSGTNNIALGYLAGFHVTTGGNNIDIGNQGGSTDAKKIRIGTEGTQTAAFIAGIYKSTVTGSPVYVNANGQLGLQATSSRRFKQDIKGMGDTSEALLSLRPVTYEYKPDVDPKGLPQFGLIAEEVENACPNLVIHDEQGKPYAVRYDAVNVMLLNEFLKEHEKVSRLETAISQEQGEIKELTASLKAQASLLQKVSAQVQTGMPAPRVVSNDGLR